MFNAPDLRHAGPRLGAIIGNESELQQQRKDACLHAVGFSGPEDLAQLEFKAEHLLKRNLLPSYLLVKFFIELSRPPC